jgi:hypothetical protein
MHHGFTTENDDLGCHNPYGDKPYMIYDDFIMGISIFWDAITHT